MRGQNAAHGRTSDLQPTGDLRFADASAMELPYLVGVEGHCYRPAQTLTVLAGMGQTGADSFAKNLPFEFGKNGQQYGHSSTGGCRQIQGFG